MRVLWTARRSNWSILKEINPEYLLEGFMLKLKLQYLGHLMGRANSLKKTLMLGKIDGRRRRGQQRRWLDGIIDSMDMSLKKLREIVKDREAWHAAALHGFTKSYHDLVTEQQQMLVQRTTLLFLVCFAHLLKGKGSTLLGSFICQVIS